MKKTLSLVLAFIMVMSLCVLCIPVASALATTASQRLITADDIESIEVSDLAMKDRAWKMFDGDYAFDNYGWAPQESTAWASAGVVTFTITFKDSVVVTSIDMMAWANYISMNMTFYDENNVSVATASKGGFEKVFYDEASAQKTNFYTNADGVSAKKIQFAVSEGNSLVITEIDIMAHIHAYGETPTSTVSATCVDDGSDVYTCPECSATKTVIIEKTGIHDYDSEITTPADDSTVGVKTYTCKNCPDTYTEDIAPTGAHNYEGVETVPTCTERGYTIYTCTDGGCGISYKGDYTEALGHDYKEVIVKHASLTEQGKIKYECQREGCGYFYEEDTPIAQYSDSTFQIGINNIINLGQDGCIVYPAELVIPGAGPDGTDRILTIPTNTTVESLFDGLLPGDFMSSASGYWGGPDGTVLTLEFDYEYYIISAAIHWLSNWNAGKVEFFDKDGISVGVYENNGMQNLEDGLSYIDVANKKAKKVVITTISDKQDGWVGGTSLKWTELEIIAHKCVFDETERANIVTDGCKVTFDGTCYICGESFTGFVDYDHTYGELIVDGPATCGSNGRAHYECTNPECTSDIPMHSKNVSLPATGEHSFTISETIKDVTCGADGMKHMRCSVCGAYDVDEVVPATGKHSFEWVAIETDPSTYTHRGREQQICKTCGFVNDGSEREAELVQLPAKLISSSDYTIRYTDYVSPRANFKMNLSSIYNIENEGYIVSVVAKVKNEEGTEKSVIMYGNGARGTYDSSTGEFSLVVKGADYTSEYEFSVDVTVTKKGTTESATKTYTAKVISTNDNAMVDALDVAKYLTRNESAASNLEDDMRAFCEAIVAKYGESNE